jgi:hypothetical protein
MAGGSVGARLRHPPLASLHQWLKPILGSRIEHELQPGHAVADAGKAARHGPDRTEVKGKGRADLKRNRDIDTSPAKGEQQFSF